MSDLKICRICLRTEARMYKFDNSQLMYYYEEVMAQKVYTTHELPHYFCYECATLLHKFHKFKEKCYRGLNMLKELLYKGPITIERIYKVDRRMSNLTSSLGILTVSKRVKTYTAESSFYDSDDDDDDNDKSEQDLVDAKKIVENVESEAILHNRSSFSDYDDNHDTLDNICIDNKTLISDNEPISNALYLDLDANVKENKASSPTTIFIDDKREIVKLESEPVKESKETAIAIVEPTKRYKFKKQTKVLDANHWKKFILSEEEAIKQFRDRAENPRYATWPFKCQDCFKGFSKEEILKRHRRLRHDESMPLECRFCHMRYKWNAALRKHMRQHFNKYQCLRCNLVCPLETTALLHEDSHNGVVKKCIHCNIEFTHLSTYYTHLRTHRSEYVCIHCGVSFVSLAGLNQHKRLKHFDDEIDSPEDDEEVNTYCEKCDIRFETRKAYDQHHFHSAMHVEGMEDELKDEFSVPRKVLGKKRRSEITKELSKRPTQVEPIHSLKKRYRRGNRKSFKKPMDCHQCGKHFETQAACLKHHLVEHPRTSFCPPTERHICEICGASLAPGSVANHQNMHTREKIFSCNICGRGFHASVSLKRHMVTHTGERPYGCTLCDKKFTQSNSMKLHYRTFHLKEPYPKRNRRKKDEPKTATEEAEESRTEESEDSQPTSRGEMQYLTLQ